LWYGYIFSAPSTSEKDYMRDNGVTDSIAYTIRFGAGKDDTEAVVDL